RPERGVQPMQLVRRERADPALRMELRVPQDLVGIGVPDPADERLVLQQVPDLAALRFRALAELGFAPAERAGVGAELREAGRVDADVDLAHPDVVAVAQLGPAFELDAHARALGRLPPPGWG